jgi:perosamine synthetase
MVEKFGYKEGDFPITDKVCQRTMALPFHNNLTMDEAKLVCGELKAALDEIDRGA